MGCVCVGVRVKRVGEKERLKSKGHAGLAVTPRCAILRSPDTFTSLLPHENSCHMQIS